MLEGERLRAIKNFKGTDSPHGCGANSLYGLAVKLQRQPAYSVTVDVDVDYKHFAASTITVHLKLGDNLADGEVYFGDKKVGQTNQPFAFVFEKAPPHNVVTVDPQGGKVVTKVQDAISPGPATVRVPDAVDIPFDLPLPSIDL